MVWGIFELLYRVFPRIDSDWSLVVLGVKRSFDDIKALREQSRYAFGLVIRPDRQSAGALQGCWPRGLPNFGTNLRRGQSR